MLRIVLIIAVFCSLGFGSVAQDSVKKAVPAKVYPKHIPYKYRAVPPNAAGAYPVNTNPAAARPTAVKTIPVRRDSGAVPAPAPAVIADKTLNGQYQYLLSKLYHYQQPLVAALWKSAADTLNISRNKLKAATANLAAQKKVIDSLNTELTTKDKSLDATSTRVDSISLLGIPLTKSAYNLLMWGLVVVFGLTAAFVIIRSGSHSREANYRIKLYNELEEEFKTYKVKANEKEKKLARELQTERNKLDELLGRS